MKFSKRDIIIYGIEGFDRFRNTHKVQHLSSIAPKIFLEKLVLERMEVKGERANGKGGVKGHM